MVVKQRADLEVADPSIAKGLDRITLMTLHDLIEALAAFEVQAAADEQTLRNAVRIPRIESEE